MTRPSVNFLKHQRDINYKMRQILIDWMMSLISEFRLNYTTLHLSVAILDKFLSIYPVTRKNLQCVGICSLYIASKLDEEYSPSIEDMAYICDGAYTKKEIAEMENTILTTLDYNVMLDHTMTNFGSLWKQGETKKLEFFLDCILLNKDILYGHDIDELLESCVEASVGSGTYWSSCLNQIIDYKDFMVSNNFSGFDSLASKYSAIKV